MFTDWLEMVLVCLEALPGMAVAAHRGEVWEDPHGTRWANWHERYRPAAMAELVAATGELLASAEAGYQDVIGSVYMAGSMGGHLGQFFTPMPVAEMMASTTLGDAEKLVWERLRAAVSRSDLATAALLASLVAPGDLDPAWLVEHVMAPAAEFFEPVTILDPSVGSGVMLLAAAAAIPRWMIDAGLVAFCGNDIDETCTKMTRVNVMLYGLNGYGADAIVALGDVGADADAESSVATAPPKTRRASPRPARAKVSKT